jgi:lipoprotein-releasing system permease protein
LNFPLFLAKRITAKGNRTFSRLIVRVAIAGIVLGLAIMILSLAVLRGFKQEVIAKQRGFAGDISVFKFDLNTSYDNTPFKLSDSSRLELMKIEGIKAIQPIATKPGIIHANDEVEGVVLKGINKDYDQSFLRNILVAGNGIDFSDEEKAKEQIIISQVTAKRMSLNVGDSFIMYFVQEPLRKRKLTIVGIYNLGVEEVDESYVIGDLGLIQRLNDWGEDVVGAYEIKIDNFENIAQETAAVIHSLPIDLRAWSVKEQFPQVFKWLDLLDVNTEVIFILMLIVAIINMISALLIMILERTEMIGILKALGFSNGGIRKVFLYNAIYLIGIGLFVGNVVGLGICYFQDLTHFFKLDEASYYVSYVPISLKITDVIFLNIGIMTICLLALLIPSGLVSRISPVKAISFK